MESGLTFTFTVLVGLVAVEGVAAQAISRRIASLSRIYAGKQPTRQFSALATGTPAPAFSAQVFETGRVVQATDLKGHTSILFFISAGHDTSESSTDLIDDIHALSHQSGGHLWVVCEGTGEACRRIMGVGQTQCFSTAAVPIIIDEQGQIAKRFLVTDRPVAVELDSDARIVRYGRSSSTPAVTGLDKHDSATFEEKSQHASGLS